MDWKDPSTDYSPEAGSKEKLVARSLPDSHKDLFDKKAFAHLATLLPDGSPQTTPVWCGYDGTHVLINTARGRRKLRNLERDPRVALSLTDPENPYRYLEIRGRVCEITEEGATAHIDALAQKYLGVDKYPYGQPGEVRVLLRIEPEHFSAMG